MAISKVVFGGNTLMDLTEDTVTPETLMAGETAHDASGKKIIGTAASSGSGGVTSFNGRRGDVLPVAGDYDATQVDYASSQTVKQKIDTVAGVWTSAVSCLVGDTSKTISNSSITTSSVVKPYSQTSSGIPVTYKKIVVSSGYATITFASALTEAASIKLQIL